MIAELALSATKFGWQCTNCHQLFDAMWRPVEPEKVWRPPVAYMWMADKPPFRFCPNCGIELGKEVPCGEEICELRVE